MFRYSCINLNTTVRYIHSGIPLRALDIMACGGFLFSNYQPELTEYFEDGVSIAIYSGIEELNDKAGWYLDHKEARESIAQRGYDIVCKYFNYKTALKCIFDRVDQR